MRVEFGSVYEMKSKKKRRRRRKRSSQLVPVYRISGAGVSAAAAHGSIPNSVKGYDTPTDLS